MDGIVIRQARPDELDAVATLLDRAWTEFDALGAGEPTYQSYRASVPDVAARAGDGVIFVAEAGGALLGTVHYYPPRPGQSRGEDWPSGWASIRYLGVDPSARGTGVGGALAEAMVELARADGAPVLGLHTSEWMAVARDMYERMGFVRYPEHDFHPRPGFVVTAYRLDLRADEPERDGA